MRTVLAVATILALSTAACSSSGSGTVGGSGGAVRSPSGSSTSSGSSSGSPAASSTHASSRPSSVPAAASGSRDVCSLLSAAEATRLNHVPYSGATSRHVTAGFDTCTYKNAGHAADPIDIQGLDVHVVTAANCYAELNQSIQGASKVTPVSGVGDQAEGYAIGLLVRSGSTCVEIEGLTHAEFSGNWAPDIAMAKLILGRL